MRKRIYIAGPMTYGDNLQNAFEAFRTFRQLIRLGFSPHCPQMAMLISRMIGDLSHETWMDVDLPWVHVSDAVLRLPGESPGADQECREAAEQGITVYHHIEDLIVGEMTKK
jgi:hypothetical protein